MQRGLWDSSSSDVPSHALQRHPNWEMKSLSRVSGSAETSFLTCLAWSVMALIAYYERRWRYLQAWVVLPDIISFLIFLLWVNFLPRACNSVCGTAPHGSDSLLWKTVEISAGMGCATWYHIFSYILTVSTSSMPRGLLDNSSWLW